MLWMRDSLRGLRSWHAECWNRLSDKEQEEAWEEAEEWELE